ncbi:hypothetical protein F3Y22_tig00000340pilonHSYRG00175 [Hibiscus syriacus]|uniref:Ubiquinone biosynthesis protein n=1 Tax=Hibiscus syriacus TaxID=106335 RepID=A0A6A3D3Y3_HIBSY|nr:hypothetical protein F3Y22_tig00000340pilonHSYRG00175 [Hibiscus syriacus]
MYRTVVNRNLLSGGGRRLLLHPDMRTVIVSSRFSTTTESQPIPNRAHNPPDSSTSSSSSTGFQQSSVAGDVPRHDRKNPRAEYEGEQARVLQASLRHVAHPLNVSTSFKQRAMLVDEIWHAAGDETSDLDLYVKRTVLGGIYSTTEIYMLTDSSPEFRDTCLFLDNRVKDAFDLKKTIQEAKYLAEAVGAGMVSSLQGFVGKELQR